MYWSMGRGVEPDKNPQQTKNKHNKSMHFHCTLLHEDFNILSQKRSDALSVSPTLPAVGGSTDTEPMISVCTITAMNRLQTN